MSIAGTYFTSWEYDISSNGYQLGPIVVIGTNNSVTVDGVSMNGAVVTSDSVAWSNASGNPSSGFLSFAFSSTYNAMTFAGVYWLADAGEPSESNLYGFATQPSAPLSTWNDTYYCYESTNGGEQSVGQLVVSGSTVTFAGQTISNPIYTGLSTNGTDTTELAWFTTSGNANNVAISFFSSTQDPGALLFNGNIWPSGSSRPEGAASTVNNFYGTTQSESDADAVDQLANLAQAAENAAVNYGVQQLLHANQQNADDEAEEDDADDDAGDAAADDAAGDAAGDAAADAGAEAGADAALDVAADVLLAVAAILAVEPPPDLDKPVSTPRRDKKARGLSARQLLDLKTQ